MLVEASNELLLNHHLNGLANVIIAKCAFVEVETVGVMRVMEQKLVLQEIPTPDSDQQYLRFQIRTHPKSRRTMFIDLKILKGSLLTEHWNKFSRFDDAYEAHVTINDNQHLLWEVHGINPYTLKITKGNVNWHLMKKIYMTCEMEMVGLQFFAKMLIQFLLAASIYQQQHKYAPPMPATYMHNYLVVVMTCPFVYTLSHIPQSSQKYYRAFQCNEDGSARWLTDYTLSWKNAVMKVLHKQTAAYNSKDYTPLVPFEQRHDVGLRVVEIFKTPLGTVDEAAVVIELVYFCNWSKIVRFVIVDIESLYLAFEDPLKLTWAIAVYDEIDWIQAVNNWLEHHFNETTALDLYRVDFRNSSQWGTK